MKTKFLKATLLVCLVCCLSSCEKGFDMIGIPRTYYLSSEGNFDATCKVLQNEATVEATMLADTEHAKLIVRMDNEADTISAKKVTRTYNINWLPVSMSVMWESTIHPLLREMLICHSVHQEEPNLWCID